MDNERRKKLEDPRFNSVNGSANAALSIKTLGTEGTKNMPERRSCVRRRETDMNKEERVAMDIKLSHCSPGLYTKDNRRKSDVRPLPKDALTVLAQQPRRNSTSEVMIEQHYISNNDLKPSSAAWMNDEDMHTSLIGESETHRFPNFPPVPGTCETFQLTCQPDRVHRKESNIRLQRQHRRYDIHTEYVSEKRYFDTQDFADRQCLPVHSGLTRGRSFSDSDLEDSFMTAEQREELDRLKQQIYETNSRRKNCQKFNGRKSDLSSNGCKHSRTEGSIFPVLTEKSLKHHSKSHEIVNWDAPESLALLMNGVDGNKPISGKARASDMKSPSLYLDSAGNMIQTDFDKSGTSLNSESSELALMHLATTHYTENLQKQDSRNRSNIQTPPTSEDDDSFSSFNGVNERLRARSEPGDVGTRKLPAFKQLQSRERSDSDALQAKVQSFMVKPLPSLPPSTLRVKKSSKEVATKFGHFKSGTNANIAPEPRRKKGGVINIHTCPNLNVFSDQSWRYQDKSKKKHRYIRGPATPVPPVESVFSEDSKDNDF